MSLQHDRSVLDDKDTRAKRLVDLLEKCIEKGQKEELKSNKTEASAAASSPPAPKKKPVKMGFMCPFNCGKILKSNATLCRHRKECWKNPAKELPFACGKCKVSFSRAEHLRRHSAFCKDLE